MKKAVKFIRSMKFGIILLVLIMAISFFGTVIEQGQAEEVYLANYSAGHLILALGLDHVYYTPYFLCLGVLLILNLTLCSLVRFKSIFGAGQRSLAAALRVQQGTKVTAAQLEKIQVHLEKKHYHKKSENGQTVFYKNQIGHIGSFLVHLSLVLLLLLGALVLYTGKSQVYGIGYDAPVTLEDGTVVGLVDFVMTDAEGNVHYESTLDITTPDGRQITDSTSVNYPINFAGKKYFQDTFGYAVQLRILNTATGIDDEVYLTEPVFLQTSESGAGIYYMAAYTDYQEGPDGQLSILSERIEPGKPAAFLVSTLDGTENGMSTGLVEEGTTLEVEDIQFTFEALRGYPGIRIKETSRVLMGCLYTSFGIMIVGLWFCFFQQPVYVTAGKSAKGSFYHISGLRNTEGMETELELCMEETGGKP